MRSSQALLPALACLSLALGAIPHGSAQRAVPFCGSPPPGWTPPAISTIVLLLSRPEPASQAGKAYVMLFWYGPAQLALAWLLLAALT